jgi:putative transposase
MRVGRARYYAYLKCRVSGAPGASRAAPRPRRSKTALTRIAVGTVHGARAAALKIGRRRVRSVMRAEGWRAIQPRSFKPRTTDSRHDARRSPNWLKDVAAADEMRGAVLVGDITYLPVRDGRFGYLATFQDKVTRRPKSAGKLPHR